MSYREYLAELARFDPYKSTYKNPDGSVLRLTTRGHIIDDGEHLAAYDTTDMPQHA